MIYRLFACVTVAASLALVGCATTNDQVLDVGGQTQLEKRSYQTRTFESADKELALRAVISTLQDLGFVIDRADLMLGSVSGTRFDVKPTKITVSVREKGNEQMTVRANAQYGLNPVDDPKQYQDFFSSLEKALFISAETGG